MSAIRGSMLEPNIVVTHVGSMFMFIGGREMCKKAQFH